jgi:hypothetical protein
MERVMKYDYEKNREYQIDYQKSSEKAKAARKRYYEKNKHRWKEYSKKYRSEESGQAKAILSGCKHRAKAKSLDFNLEISDILPFPTICPVLGIEILLGQDKNSPNSPSIDRIDNTKGYTKDNIKVISLRANSLKGGATLEELDKILQYMSNYTKRGIDS